MSMRLIHNVHLLKYTSCLPLGSAPFSINKTQVSSFSDAVSHANIKTGMPSLEMLLTSAPLSTAISKHLACLSVGVIQ